MVFIEFLTNIKLTLQIMYIEYSTASPVVFKERENMFLFIIISKKNYYVLYKLETKIIS